MNTKAMLILTLAAFITGCSPASVATTTTAGSTTAGQTTSSRSGTSQPVATTGTATTGSNASTSPATTTTKAELVKAELGKPIVFDPFEITINSIKKFAKGVMVDYTFVNRQADAFSSNYMMIMQLSQNGKVLYADPSFRYEDKTFQERASFRSAQIRQDIPVNLMGFFPAKLDSPITLQLASKIGTRQQSEPLVLDFPKEEFKVSEISPLVEIPAGVKPIADNVPDLKVGEVLELQTMKIVVDGIYAMKDSQGMDGLMLEYTRTLKSDLADYQADFYLNIFQNGKALVRSSIMASLEIMDTLAAGSYRLLPGVSVKSLEFIDLSDDKTDLEIEFNEWKNIKPVKRVSIKTAVPTQKITMAQLEEKVKAGNAANNAAARAFLPQTEDRTLIGKKIEKKTTEFTINGTRRTKDKAQNLILDITINNKSMDDYVLSVNLIVVYQNGVELNRNFNFSDPNDQTLNTNLNSDVLNKPVEAILSYQLRDSSMVVIEIYDKPEPGKDLGQKQVLVIKP